MRTLIKGKCFRFRPLILFIVCLILLMIIMSFSGRNRSIHLYTAYSRFTDPGKYLYMLENTPTVVESLCEMVRRKTVNHLLLLYRSDQSDTFGLHGNSWSADVKEIFSFFREHNTCFDDDNESRFVSTCSSESHLLACLLRHHHFPVRIRAGFLKNIRSDQGCIRDFWHKVATNKADKNGLEGEAREQWIYFNDALTCLHNVNDHHIEHWVCEYFNVHDQCWRLLDANPDFLKCHSNIEVGYHLPVKYFEYSWQAWRRMRQGQFYNEKSYREELQDGRSHIRSMLLWDFYSMLNHDLAGLGEGDSHLYHFIRMRKYSQLSAQELKELDALAGLLAQDPAVVDLVAFYLNSKTLRWDAVESDRYGFVYRFFHLQEVVGSPFARM